MNRLIEPRFRWDGTDQAHWRRYSRWERVRFSVYETIWALVAVDWATWALRACIAAVILVLFWAFGVAASWPDKAP